MPEAMILVVEDEPSIAEVVSVYLKRAGYQVQTAQDGSAALQICDRKMPDLIIMDLMLPQMGGYEVTRKLREESEVPIIMLTARREEVDRIAGLEMGADDYVVKPFSPQELVSRVRAVLRRTRDISPGERDKPLIFSDLQISSDTRLVTVKGKEVVITAKEFDMLWLLARHPRHVFTRQQLLERVWGISEYIDPSTVTVHIRRLREKIEADPSNPTHILTLWGIGYKFEP
jgi:two-component system response regulator ResD